MDDQKFQTLTKRLFREFSTAVNCSYIKSYDCGGRKEEYVSVTMRNRTPERERGRAAEAVKHMDFGVPVRFSYT